MFFMNSAVRELQVNNFKRCPKCRELQPIAVFYTKGTDRNGRVRYDTHCITHKLEHIRQRGRKLRLASKRSKFLVIEVANCEIIETPNRPGGYLPSEVLACLSNLIAATILDSPNSELPLSSKERASDD
jgi:hypothetical protein